MRAISPKPVRYELIIYWSKEDDSFVVEVPELPRSMAEGQTYAEAVANAEVVIDEWSDWGERHGRLSRDGSGRALREQPRYNGLP